MTGSNSLPGLIKWVSKEPWRGAFLEVLNDHIGPVCEEYDIPSFDELDGLIGPDFAMTLWGCAFEDFLTQEVEGAGYMVDDYLKRRGWKESATNKAYIAGLKNSIMSLYEASDIEPGRSFRARDLVHGGDPAIISERTATKSLKQWDKVAMRVVEVRGKKVIGGGLLPYDLDLAEQFLAAVKEGEDYGAANIPELMGKDSEPATPAFNLAPHLSLCYLGDLIERVINPVMPRFANSSGEDIELIRVVYRLAKGVSTKKARTALNRIPELDAASETFWNWIETQQVVSRARNAPATRTFALVTTSDNGSLVLGNVELKPKTIELSVNSEARADRGRKMLEAALKDLVRPPLVERQSLEQAMSEIREKEAGTEMPELSAEDRRSIVHETMDRHYRAQLDEPIPALGNLSPRKAAKSKAGRQKLVAWLKRIENSSGQHKSDDPMASYDTTWMWDELGVSGLKK